MLIMLVMGRITNMKKSNLFNICNHIHFSKVDFVFRDIKQSNSN